MHFLPPQHKPTHRSKLAQVATKKIAAYAMLALPAAVFCQDFRAIDDAGHALRLPQAAQRIVSLAPNLAELVYAAGAGARLIGVGRFSDYPAAVQKLPVLGDAFALNLEAIAALKPDLVLLWQSGTPERQRDALRALAQRQGFAVFESEVRSVADIASTLERIGQLAGTQRSAQAAAGSLLRDWQALQTRYAQAKPVRVFYQVWDAPLMTFNGQHIISQAIRACGGVQGFDTMSALTPSISREAVLAFNPQLILAGGDGTASKELAAWRALPQIDAVQHQQLQAANAALLSRMGPRFVQAASALCQQIDATRSRW